jgi:Ca2+-binding RTX toxin-like protein
VTLNGTPGADTVSLSGAANLNATGLPAALTITGAESARDRLTVNGAAGNDSLDASAVGAGAILLTLNGDTENDTLRGGAGPDNLNGGDGDDEIFAGPGDTANGGAGSDIIHFP